MKKSSTSRFAKTPKINPKFLLLSRISVQEDFIEVSSGFSLASPMTTALSGLPLSS